MKRLIFLFFAFIFLYNCTSNTIYKKPTDLIPKDSMVILIQQMLIASSSKNVKTINLQRKIDYFPFVYDRFKIDSTRFQKSSFYYISKIEAYDEILAGVKKGLEIEKEKYRVLKKRKDSINRDSVSKLNIKKPIKKDALKEPLEFSKKKKALKAKL
tara:strand:- start:183 stop:650 length:468 start_codon:yes stop_codon:yes gene_type:complete